MTNRTLLLIFLAFASTLCQAELTMLMRFDEAGHHIHRVVVLDDESPIERAIESQRSSDPSVNPGMQIHWFDRAGMLLGTSFHQDPRRTHTPSAGRQSAESALWVALKKGAYRVTGPSETASMVVELSMREFPLLAAERWVLTVP